MAPAGTRHRVERRFRIEAERADRDEAVAQRLRRIERFRIALADVAVEIDEVAEGEVAAELHDEERRVHVDQRFAGPFERAHRQHAAREQPERECDVGLDQHELDEEVRVEITERRYEECAAHAQQPVRDDRGQALLACEQRRRAQQREEREQGIGGEGRAHAERVQREEAGAGGEEQGGNARASHEDSMVRRPCMAGRRARTLRALRAGARAAADRCAAAACGRGRMHSRRMHRLRAPRGVPAGAMRAARRQRGQSARAACRCGSVPGSIATGARLQARVSDSDRILAAGDSLGRQPAITTGMSGTGTANTVRSPPESAHAGHRRSPSPRAAMPKHKATGAPASRARVASARTTP